MELTKDKLPIAFRACICVQVEEGVLVMCQGKCV